ncbi:MAG: NAD(P)-binding protein [candidate division Zixibacteria bacterium]|nr:NAD(P)-binding protein [candidate division Zixibacteria bacterium]
MADPSHCIIIGAGIAGLSAARRLKELSIPHIVLDKGRSVGGRMATRRIGKALCDHGAQVISAQGPDMICTVDEWRDSKLVKSWGPIKTRPHRGSDFYYAINGMNSIAKHLARDLDVHTSWQAQSVMFDNDIATIQSQDGESMTARSVLLTPPMPQSLALLDAGNVSLDSEHRTLLETIDYDRCIAVLVTIPGQSNVPPPGGLWLGSEPIQWIADNRKKGLSSQETAITIHAGPEFSDSHWETDFNEVAQTLLNAASKWIGPEHIEVQVHRWRYSQAIQTHPKPFALLESPGLLAFAGDGFRGDQIEGARLSGIAAANALAKHLRS